MYINLLWKSQDQKIFLQSLHSVLPVNICISIPPRTLLAQTSYASARSMRLCRVVDSHRAPKTNSGHLLQFPLNKNNELMLRSHHVVSIITRLQPVMFYLELFTSSDPYLCLSITLSTPKWICSSLVGGISQSSVSYVHYFCNIMCFLWDMK